MTMNLPRDNKSSCEREATLVLGQSLPQGSSLSRVHVNRPLISSFQTNIFQGDFKIGPVPPIFKSGDKEDFSNYRPTSVLPTVARIFKKLLYDQFYKYFMDNEVLGNTQWGFRSLYSTTLGLK